MEKSSSIVALRTDEIVQPSALQTILGGDFIDNMCVGGCEKNRGECRINLCQVNDYDCSINDCTKNINPFNPIGPTCPKAV